jgi:hypothetical protein
MDECPGSDGISTACTRTSAVVGRVLHGAEKALDAHEDLRGFAACLLFLTRFSRGLLPFASAMGRNDWIWMKERLPALKNNWNRELHSP